MNRSRQHEGSFALAQSSWGAEVRRGRREGVAGSASAGPVTQRILALWGFVALVSVMLAVAAGVPFSAHTGAQALSETSVEVAEAAGETGGRTAEAWQGPRDGRDRPVEEGEASLELETNDDEEARSNSFTAASVSRSVTSPTGPVGALCSRPGVAPGHSLVSTGLSRGPPLAS